MPLQIHLRHLMFDLVFNFHWSLWDPKNLYRMFQADELHAHPPITTLRFFPPLLPPSLSRVWARGLCSRSCRRSCRMWQTGLLKMGLRWLCQISCCRSGLLTNFSISLIVSPLKRWKAHYEIAGGKKGEIAINEKFRKLSHMKENILIMK